jgi:hypothetical protein
METDCGCECECGCDEDSLSELCCFCRTVPYNKIVSLVHEESISFNGNMNCLKSFVKYISQTNLCNLQKDVSEFHVTFTNLKTDGWIVSLHRIYSPFAKFQLEFKTDNVTVTCVHDGEQGFAKIIKNNS